MINKQIEDLLFKAGEIFLKEEQLLEINTKKAVIVGDTHGDLETTTKVIENFLEKGDIVIFLGDYVDRGPYQIENINYLLEKKINFPNKLFLLRGNHETPSMNLYYGFYSNVISKYSIDIYNSYIKIFSLLPYAAVINNKVFCVHGGIAENLINLEQIKKIPKGEIDPSSSLIVQILWNDPRENIEGFKPSIRGPGIKFFGENVLKNFLKKNNLKIMIRSHEPPIKGYKIQFNKKLLTIFSCRYYGITPKVAVYYFPSKFSIIKIP
ncbi:MAG: metallophosphoesterase [Nitrososphaerota archaeon]